MKLIRFGNAGLEMPGIINEDGQWLDVSSFGEDYNQQFLESDGLLRLGPWLKENISSCATISRSERLGPPLSNPSKIICVGLNYAKHAKESGMALPKEPILFFKATSSFSGPFDNVIIPKGSKKTDWEVELAIVIGKKANYVEKANAMDYITGYAVLNDVSERAYQLERGGQWVKGKSADTFAPFGPVIVTKDEVSNPDDLNLWLKLNGKKIQDSNTNDLIFGVAHLVSYISNFMTLLPGDIISTGTPSGVGMGHKPPIYLKPGDVMELGVEGLGVSRQEVVGFEQ